jgi:hypothetical protein
MWKPFGVRNTVEIMLHGKDRGIDEKALLSQDLKRPYCLLHNREAGGAIRNHRAQRLVAETLCCAAHIRAKLLGGLSMQSLMSVSMAANFVTSLGDLPYHAGELLRDPAQDEECGPGVVFLENLENAVYVSFHPWGKGFPGVNRNARRKSFYVKVIFYIDAENV